MPSREVVTAPLLPTATKPGSPAVTAQRRSERAYWWPPQPPSRAPRSFHAEIGSDIDGADSLDRACPARARARRAALMAPTNARRSTNRVRYAERSGQAGAL